MNSELRTALETITNSINELKESNKKLWMTVETLKVRIGMLEDAGESVDQDVLDSIASLQAAKPDKPSKAPTNGASNDPLYDKAVMIVSDSSSGVTSKTLMTLLGCSGHALKGVRARMEKEGIAFHPLGGKIYPIVNGEPRGYRDQTKSMQPSTLKNAMDAVMKIDVPVVDKTATDITTMLRERGTPVSQSALTMVLDKMCSDGLVSSKPNPRFKGRHLYSF